jgi:hypothetical protein
MFRHLAGRLSPTSPSDGTDLFKLHPIQLHRYLDEAWRVRGIVRTTVATPPEVFLGDNPRIVDVMKRPDALLDPSSIMSPGASTPTPLPPPPIGPWEHLIYAYLMENTQMVRIFRRVVEMYLVGEQLEVPSDVTRQWLRSTEQLFLRESPPFTISALTSQVRPDLEATRRNAYWRLLGMDLDHGGHDGRPVPYAKVGAANIGFVAALESFMGECWQGYVNRMNSSGENTADPSSISNRADIVSTGLRVRRRGGNLAVEEYVITAMLSWFHLTLEWDNPIIQDLKANASHPAERLRKIGERVGIAPHPRSRDLMEMAQEASTILRFVELEEFSTDTKAEALYANPGPIRDDMLKLINHWSLATGRNVKVRRPDTGPAAMPRQATTAPVRAGRGPNPLGRNGELAHNGHMN